MFCCCIGNYIVVCDVVALEQGFVDGLFGVLDARVRGAQERVGGGGGEGGGGGGGGGGCPRL